MKSTENLSAQGSKTFDYINFAYGAGASIVIIGAMFKFLGWNYANELFLVGLTTEAVVFFISAFEFKKAESKDYEWEKVFPQLDGDNDKSYEYIVDVFKRQEAAFNDFLVLLRNSQNELSAKIANQAEGLNAKLISQNDSIQNRLLAQSEELNARVLSQAEAIAKEKAMVLSAGTKLNENVGQIDNSIKDLLNQIGSFKASFETVSQEMGQYSSTMIEINKNVKAINAYYANFISAMKMN